MPGHADGIAFGDIVATGHLQAVLGHIDHLLGAAFILQGDAALSPDTTIS
jgi:hypothetical protein